MAVQICFFFFFFFVFYLFIFFYSLDQQFRSAAFSCKVPKGSSLQHVKHFITKHYCPQTSTKILKKHLQDLKENFGLALSAPDILPPTKKQTVSRLYPGSANRDEVALSLLRKNTTQSNQLFNLQPIQLVGLTGVFCKFLASFAWQLHEKFLQFDWLRTVVFQLNLKYPRVVV